MGAWRERFQAMAMAAAFAEEGEWDTALSMVKKERSTAKAGQADLKKRPDRRPRPQTYRA
jgi:hypothetical protein